MAIKNLPKLVVFDLDYTLWPFWVDTHVNPPFKKENGEVYDSRGAKVECYPESTQVLEHCKKLGMSVAAASRTGEIKGAQQLIELFGWDQFFDYKEIYPGNKRNHFKRFIEQTNLGYDDMLFFDDEYRNIRDLTAKDVTCVLVKNGMSMNVLLDGLQKYKEEHS